MITVLSEMQCNGCNKLHSAVVISGVFGTFLA